MDRKLIHICEACGKTEILTPEERLMMAGTIRREWAVLVLWDHEHAGACPINLTVWWAVVSEKKSISELPRQYLAFSLKASKIKGLRGFKNEFYARFMTLITVIFEHDMVKK